MMAFRLLIDKVPFPWGGRPGLRKKNKSRHRKTRMAAFSA
jgi:hypothetical protein